MATENPSGQNMPTLIGFGIHDHETFEMACKHADGAIIGTAFIRFLEERLGRGKNKREPSEARYREIHEICRIFLNRIRGIS
jgi:tryptophan synthase alpha subunit